jgi:hypothetical protein
MIQRIQTVLLAVAAIASVAVVFIPIGTIVDTLHNNVALYEYGAFSLKECQDGIVGNGVLSTVYVALIWIASAILSVVTIFMYKNRQRQIRMNNVNMVVMLAAIVVMLYVYPNLVFEAREYVTPNFILNFNYWIAISLIPAISIYFANTAIKRDEKKVRAADRLR